MTALGTRLVLAMVLAGDAGAPSVPAAAPRPAAPLLLGTPARKGGAAPPVEEFPLRPAKDGTGDLIYEAPAFTARVAPDGTARFVDRGGVFLNRGWSLIPFVPLAMPNGTPTLQGAVVDLLSKRRRPPARAPRAEAPRDPPMPVPNMSRYRPDPREACGYGTPCFFQHDPRATLTAVAGSFDLTDEILRFNGEDPYRREKALFLAATRERRASMAAHALAADARRATSELVARLEAIACDERRSVSERRAVIEALRGELDGATPEAREAVATIARFVAAHFDAADGGARCGR
jgi:hypothetical protein